MDIEEYELRNNNKNTNDCRLETKQTKKNVEWQKDDAKAFLNATNETKNKNSATIFNTESATAHKSMESTETTKRYEYSDTINGDT